MGRIKEYFRKKLIGWCAPEMMQPPKIEITHTNLNHYAACTIVGDYEFEQVPPEIKETEIFRSIMREIEPAIKKNLVAKRDFQTRHTTYRLDLWLVN